MAEKSNEMEQYFKSLDSQIKVAYKAASDARKKGQDPEDYVDIPLAKNMAQRVVGLVGDVAPQITGTKITKRIEELEKKHPSLDWRVAFKIAEEVANQNFCKFNSKKEAMETGIRVGFAYLTGGIVSAPLEGFIELRIKKRKDGKEYFSVFYAGPVRGAGGTAAAVSVVLADYVRKKMGYSPYDPSEDEVNRYCTEIRDYHERVTNLQYLPTEKEMCFLAKRLPVEVNGDPTELIEVSNYKDLERVETNRIRGGVCLVLAEGIAQKATKVWKKLGQWGNEFGLEWDFLKDFLTLQKKIKAKGASTEEGERISPNYTYIKDLVAGRPVLAHPLKPGGFRLRYGRTRLSGFSAAGINPATMEVLNGYIATGTQLRVERPGKATAITPCDCIEGPIVKLNDGSVVLLNKESHAKKYKGMIKEILFIGDILFNYGDFSENGHVLVPCGYNEEWHIKDIEKATVNMFGALDLDKLSDLVSISKANLDSFFQNPMRSRISSRAAINISEKLGVPLHPAYTYHWNSLSYADFMKLLIWMKDASLKKEGTNIMKTIIPIEEGPKRSLEIIGLPHLVVNNEFVVINSHHSHALLASLGFLSYKSWEAVLGEAEKEKEKKTLEIINRLSPIAIRDKSETFIGARMGRPEKAKMRRLTGRPHVLFPVGEQGGRLRSFQSALGEAKVTANFPLYKCTKCDRETVYRVCETCNKKTKRMYHCNVCGLIDSETCKKHGKTTRHRQQSIDIARYFSAALNKLNLRTYPDLIKGVRGTSNRDHIPENLVKGILRAKHSLAVNKDGTTRYDMTEIPITHFKPSEIRLDIEKLKNLGYTKDINGKALTSPGQILELKPQDIILPSGKEMLDEPAGTIMFRVANFIDELLEKFYGLKPFYKLESESDLIGKLVIGLAPHISAGIVGRIIGFSETQALLAHPMFHAAMRRDCDGDEACCMLLMDGLLNFSRKYLPDKRGGRTMDSPLVLTSTLNAAEVDDMVHGMDVPWSYPLEFYEACNEYKNPWEIEIEQVRKRIGTEKQYEGYGYTHGVSNINMGVRCSAYKTLPSMEDKLKGQMELAEKITAVDESDVARLIIEKHFLRDINGNLRKFSQQQFRCVKCNEKYRRPPIRGRCLKCDGKIIFTISEGSIIKYLGPSISIANTYNVSTYLKQTLELTQRRVEAVFGKDKEKQEGLGKWFG